MSGDTNYQSSADLNRSRRRYYLHSILNGISFRFLAGNIITIYALRLGAGNTYVGVVSSFVYASMVFIIVGRSFVSRFGAVRTQATFWTVRYLCMIPAVFTAIPAVRANPTIAFALLAIAAFGFHTFKGIALAGQKPILGSIIGEGDRGAFLSRLQSLNTSFSTVAWLILGFALGADSRFEVYAATFIIGIIVGLGSSWALGRIPEPKETEQAAKESLVTGIRRSFESRGFRRLTSINLFRTMLLGMTGAFLIVYFRKSFLHPDADVVYITLFGSFGVVAIAAVSGFLMDKVGAKPLFFSFSFLITLTLIPIIFLPPFTTGLLYWIIPCAVIFFYNAGAMGTMNCAQDYFFATVPPEDRLTSGIVYSAASGLGGFVGSVGGGLVLDGILVTASVPEATVYRLYFAGSCILFVALSIYIARLPDIGAYSIRNTLSILFSARDLRAIRLIKRLQKPLTESEEQRTIRALGERPSQLAVDDLVPKLESPSFSVRAETLNAIRQHPPDKSVRKALIDEVTDHEYTTAHIAAEIIGIHGITDGIPALRNALDSEDFILVGKSMVALAKLGDRESIGRIKAIFSETTNPRLIIFGARALAIYGDRDSIEVLCAKLEHHYGPFMRDEIILAIAEIAALGDWFYALYSLFIDRPIAGAAELAAQVTTAPQIVTRLALEVTADPEVFVRTARSVYGNDVCGSADADLCGYIVSSLDNDKLTGLSRYRYLVAAIAVHLTRATG